MIQDWTGFYIAVGMWSFVGFLIAMVIRGHRRKK